MGEDWFPGLADLIDIYPTDPDGKPSPLRVPTPIGAIVDFNDEPTVFNATDYGVVFDRKEYSGTLTVGAGSNPALTVTGADFANLKIGQLVILPLGGAAGAGAKLYVVSVDVANSKIYLTGTVDTALTDIAYQATGNPTIASTQGGVSPGDVYTLTGGAFVVPTQVTIQTTKVLSGVAINTPGSGGVDGTYTFKGTSPAATPFQITGTITGGVLASVVPLPTTAGIYQANPPNIMAEPIVDVDGISGLTDATVTIIMGANNAQLGGQPSSISVVTVPGGYSVVPSDPVSSTGPGIDVKFNMASCWTAPTVVIGTDNAPAINAASDAIRAQAGLDASGRDACFAKLVFPYGDGLVNDSLNFTGLSRLIIDGQRSRIYSCANGLPVFDEMGSANVSNLNFTITGDSTFPPRWAYQYGRVSNTITAPANTFDQLVIEGTFSDAGFDYNFCSEAIDIGLIRGGFVAPYARIEDSCNSSVWNVTSKYITNTATPDHAQPFQGGNSGQVSLINHHPAGCGVWMLGGTDHAYNNSYFFCQEAVFVIIVSALVGVTSGLQAPNCHVETARNLVTFRKHTIDGYGVPQFSRFNYSDSACLVTENLFNVTEPGIISLRFFNTQITVQFAAANCKYFDDPSVVTFSGVVLGGDGQTQRWTNNLPADMSGLAILTGPNGPEFFAYNLAAQTDTLINGELSVGGGIQATGQIDATDGTVASIAVTSYGSYTNPDYPTVTIDTSPGVTATADVTAMQWLSDQHIISGGSGYSVGGVATLVGGTHAVAAKLLITEVDGLGAVTAFAGHTPGSYSAYPPVGATTTTGGGGTGLVISPLFWGVKKDGTGVTITNPGSGYTLFPRVSFSAPLSGSVPARGVVMMGVATSINSAGISSPFLQGSASYADDAAAALGGVAVGSFYRFGSSVMIRVT